MAGRTLAVSILVECANDFTPTAFVKRLGTNSSQNFTRQP